MKILYRLGCLLLALIGLSAFDYSRVPYQTMNPIKKVGMHFIKDTRNGSNVQNAEGNAENMQNPARNNTDNPAENVQNAAGNNMGNIAESAQNVSGNDMGNGFIINSAGHAGKKYPEGGVRICRVLYKDRENYEFIRII